MSKLISQNALILRHQYELGNYFLTHYASQNFHNALTVTFKATGEELLVALKEPIETEIFQEIDYFGGRNPKIIFTLSTGKHEAFLNDERNLSEKFILKEIESKCHILQYEETKLPEKNWQTRSHTRDDKRGTAKFALEKAKN